MQIQISSVSFCGFEFGFIFLGFLFFGFFVLLNNFSWYFWSQAYTFVDNK